MSFSAKNMMFLAENDIFLCVFSYSKGYKLRKRGENDNNIFEVKRCLSRFLRKDID